MSEERTNICVHEGYVMRHRHLPDERRLYDRARDAHEQGACPAFEMVEATVVKASGKNVHVSCIDRAAGTTDG